MIQKMENIYHLFSQFYSTSMLEWIGFITSLIYVFLASKQSNLCWIFAIISSTIYVYLCYQIQLFLESQLQIYYVVIALYGWFKWEIPEKKLSIISWKLKKHLQIIFLLILFSFILGFIFKTYTSQFYPYIDASIFVFSIFSTYLITLKLLENWIYFIVIDIVSSFVFWFRGLELTSFLYIFYTVFAIYGFLQWKKQYKLQIL
jgi:nicotinamide mononucleotide transporter